MKQKDFEPQPGQESVWDYPRPPRLEDFKGHIQVVFNNVILADTHHAIRVLETSHPPVYYIPPQDVQMEYLLPAVIGFACEWKGVAVYHSLLVQDKEIDGAAWSYPHPNPDFIPIKDHLAFYAGLMDACYVNGEKAIPQPGNFYGGWITSNILGPLKGEPRTMKD